jgi:hypothetical protein
VYPAEKTMDEEASIPAIGNLSNTPYNDKNSPKKFKVSGAPQLPKHRMKNKTQNSGMACAIPL